MIIKLQQLLRIIYINFVLIRHGLDRLVLSIPFFAPIRFVAYLLPWNWFKQDKRSRGEQIRSVLEDLGPIFVKFGQALSTRRDLLPEDIADQLELLQDRVPPFASELAQQIIESSYAKPISSLFEEFDTIPLASASVAQVHAARLFGGKEVVVKVLRPNIRKIIVRDIRLLYTLARLVERFYQDGKRLRPVEVVAEFEKTILDELDLQREAANASQLRRNFLDSPLLYVPEIYWDYVSEKTMVMERIFGIPVTDIPALRANKVNLKILAERGVEIFFTQVFRDCFFHADMHPGNIFVSPSRPDNPQYIAVDFGIMGALEKADQRYLAENFLAFFKRDYRRVAELHVESGWVPANTRVAEFESAIRTVCEPVFERPLKEISFAQVLIRLFSTARRFRMEIQPQLVLLQKTLLSIEGLGRQLYPDLDLWTTAKPFLERWISSQIGPMAFLNKVKDNAPYWSEKLPELPLLVHDFLLIAKQQEFQRRLAKEQRLPTPVDKKRNPVMFGFGLGLALVGIGNWLTISHFVLSNNGLIWMSEGITLAGILLLAISQLKKL